MLRSGPVPKPVAFGRIVRSTLSPCASEAFVRAELTAGGMTYERARELCCGLHFTALGTAFRSGHSSKLLQPGQCQGGSHESATRIREGVASS
jgi:hypothetical protein